MRTFNDHQAELKWLNAQWRKFHENSFKSMKDWHRATLRYLKYMWTHDYDETDRKICEDFNSWVKSCFEGLRGFK